MAPQRHRNEHNPDWGHIRGQVESALDWFREWDIAGSYSPTRDMDLIITLASALEVLAEHNGIDTLIYGPR